MRGIDWKVYRAYCRTPEQRQALRKIAAEYYRAINARRANIRMALSPALSPRALLGRGLDAGG